MDSEMMNGCSKDNFIQVVDSIANSGNFNYAQDFPRMKLLIDTAKEQNIDLEQYFGDLLYAIVNEMDPEDPTIDVGRIRMFLDAGLNPNIAVGEDDFVRHGRTIIHASPKIPLFQTLIDHKLFDLAKYMLTLPTLNITQETLAGINRQFEPIDYIREVILEKLRNACASGVPRVQNESSTGHKRSRYEFER